VSVWSAGNLTTGSQSAASDRRWLLEGDRRVWQVRRFLSSDIEHTHCCRRFILASVAAHDRLRKSGPVLAHSCLSFGPIRSWRSISVLTLRQLRPCTGGLLLRVSAPSLGVKHQRFRKDSQNRLDVGRGYVEWCCLCALVAHSGRVPLSRLF